MDNDSSFTNITNKNNCISFQYNNFMIKLKKSSTHEGYKPRGSFTTQFTVEDISHHTLQRHQYIKQNY